MSRTRGNPDKPREAYSPGQLYTMDEMFDEFAKWRMNATIYQDPLTKEYHCDIFRTEGVMMDYDTRTWRPVKGIMEYWGWMKGASRFEAVQNAVGRLHKIINEYREDGYEDADI